MRTAAIVVLALLACACGSFSPVPINHGDRCATCGQAITDVKIAAEAISPQGVVTKFRTPECLARYVRQQPDSVKVAFVTDFKSGRMMRPESATYVRAIIDRQTGELGYVAFSRVGDAVDFGKDNKSSPVDWLMIQRTSAERKSD